MCSENRRKQGDLTKDIRLKIYPAIIAILGLSLLALMLSRVQIQIGPNRQSADPVTVNPEVPPAPDLSASPSSTASPVPESSPVPSPLLSPSPQPTLGVSETGELRVSNQTKFPIRLALLHQQSAQSGQAKAFGQPVHWDFAPQEGAAKGLIMSLPSQKLQLQPGDVLIGFAQDGSRRYWGPYVVGQTPLPTWNAEQAEWLLVLQP